MFRLSSVFMLKKKLLSDNHISEASCLLAFDTLKRAESYSLGMRSFISVAVIWAVSILSSRTRME